MKVFENPIVDEEDKMDYEKEKKRMGKLYKNII